MTITTTTYQIEIDGELYKIGIRNMVFVRHDDEWIRSHKTVREIELAIERKRVDDEKNNAKHT